MSKKKYLTAKSMGFFSNGKILFHSFKYLDAQVQNSWNVKNVSVCLLKKSCKRCISLQCHRTDSVSSLPIHIQPIIQTHHRLNKSDSIPSCHKAITSELDHCQNHPKAHAAFISALFPSNLSSVVSPEWSLTNIIVIMPYPCFKLFKCLL